MSNDDAQQAVQPGLTAVRWLLLIAALWNFAGSLPGLLDPSGMFEQEFGRAINDPVFQAVYWGAWGTSFIYGIGFLLAARDPVRHTGIVLMGGIGKAGFTANLLRMYGSGWTSSFALVVIVGDVIFVSLFIAYFVALKRAGHRIF